MYHEYTDRNGETRRRHDNGQRLGADNQCAHLPASGESPFWQKRADNALALLAEKLPTSRAWNEWWEAMFEIKGRTVNDFTWRQMAQAAEKKLKELGVNQK